MKLYFNLQGFPRTIGREEWRSIWQWKRLETQRLRFEEAEIIRALKRTDIHPNIRTDLIDRIINPPLLIHDKQSLG